jgi:hypothetical protein
MGTIDSLRYLGELYVNGENRSQTQEGDGWRCQGVRIAESGIGDGYLWGSDKADGGTKERAKVKGKISGAHSQIRNSVFGGEEDEK